MTERRRIRCYGVSAFCLNRSVGGKYARQAGSRYRCAGTAQPNLCTTPLGPSDYLGFRLRAHQILRRRKLQSHTEVEALVRRYERPIFGEICVWDLFLRLSEVRDPTDPLPSTLRNLKLLAGIARRRTR